MDDLDKLIECINLEVLLLEELEKIDNLEESILSDLKNAEAAALLEIENL